MSDITVVVEPSPSINVSVGGNSINAPYNLLQQQINNLTGQYYPLNTNPAGYVSSTSGGTSVIVTGSNPLTSINIIGVSGTATLLSGTNLLISSSPQSSSNILTFTSGLNSGSDIYFVKYPSLLSTLPSGVSCEFINNIDNYVYYFILSSVNTSGFTVNFSDTLSTTGYQLGVTVIL